MRSLIRWPGGKGRATKIILPYLQEKEEIFSPFFGGGIIELNLASTGKRVYGYDNFEQLVNFWNYAINDTNKLYKKTIIHFNFFHSSDKTKDEKKKYYLKLKKFCLKEKNTIKGAAAFFVVNRVSYSGLTLLGGFSEMAIDMEFGIGILERLKNFKIDNLSVELLDFKESFNRHPNIMAYIDPPYYLTKGWLYGEDGSSHKNFDHEGLSNILHNRDKWILSYNNCDKVKELYNEYRIIEPIWSYGMSWGYKDEEKSK
ncbi:MAG: DNA adenine methylase, partial [Elusimicrobiota bacterium]|nr:DNA adenine methylase [Elusimicrobiota bacterium]